MNVVEEKIDDLNAILRISVSPEDYKEQVDKTLSDYGKQVNMPGFRPGKVPASLIRKKYGKAVLAEELNKLISGQLQDFIQSNNLNILGNPLPKDDEEVKGDFDNPSDFEFAYEIAVSPEFEVNLSKKDKFDYLKVKIDDEMLDKEVENLAKRYGKLVSGEEVGEKDMVMGEFSDGTLTNSSTVSMEFIEDDKARKLLTGKKVGDEVTLDPRSVSRGDSDLAAMLGVTQEELDQVGDSFNFKINEIKTMIPHEIDQELFDKLFGEGTISSEDELRARISEDLGKMFQNDSDRNFSEKVTEYIMEKTSFNLPDEFLKRWILASSEKEITAEEIETDYENYTKSLKWQLIQNKIISDNGIKVEPEEAIDYTKGLLTRQFAQYGMPPPEGEELDKQAKSVLGNQEEANKIYDNIYGMKMLHFFKETITLKEKELDYDKFVEEAFKKEEA